MFSRLLFAAELPTEALFVELILAGAVVILAGVRFTRLADTLGKRLGLASGWIGLVLLASVTSLPELITGATATWIGNVDMALGAIFGSCSFNITLIVLLNALWGGGSVLRGVDAAHTLTSSFGLTLIGMALMGLILTAKFSTDPVAVQAIEWAWSGLILVTYLGCMKLCHRFEKFGQGGTAPLPGGDLPSRRDEPVTGLGFQIALMAMILVVASWWLARTGDVLSTHEIKIIGRPLGATFVGAVFLALATSLPEIVTSITAVRLGNLNLALGNIFGSNMFNIAVIPVLKIVSFAKGDARLLPLHAAGNGSQNLIAGILAILLTAIAIAGLTYQSRRKLLGRFGFDSILIALTYVGGIVLLLMKA